jgi:FixJ family two-component response regulator
LRWRAFSSGRRPARNHVFPLDASAALVPDRSVVAIVDDDPGILRSLGYLLESADHAVLVFPSADAFFESGCLATVDCLVSDIDMPAIDGFELLLAVHAIRPTLPVILITGHPEMLDRLRYASANHHALFTKPFDGPAMLAAVGNAVSTRQS